MFPSLYSFMTLSFSTSILCRDVLCCPAPFPLPPFCPVKVILPLLLTDFPACDRFSFFSSILLFPHAPLLPTFISSSSPPCHCCCPLPWLPPSSSPPYCSIPPPSSFPPPMVIKQCPHSPDIICKSPPVGWQSLYTSEAKFKTVYFLLHRENNWWRINVCRGPKS